MAMLVFLQTFPGGAIPASGQEASLEVHTRASATLHQGDADWGAGVQLLVGRPAGAVGLFGTLGYQRLSFELGHRDLLGVGAELQRTLGATPFWAGLEAMLVREGTSYDGPGLGSDGVARGFTVGATVGGRLGEGASLFAGGGLLHVGAARRDGDIQFGGGTHGRVRLGAQLQLR